MPYHAEWFMPWHFILFIWQVQGPPLVIPVLYAVLLLLYATLIFINQNMTTSVYSWSILPLVTQLVYAIKKKSAQLRLTECDKDPKAFQLDSETAR